MNDENPELAEGADAQPEDQAEQDTTTGDDTAETPQDIAGGGGSADPEDAAETQESEEKPTEVETEPFRETVAEASPEQPAHDVVTPTIEDEDLSQQHPDEEDETETSAPTRTFFGREYEQAENGALRQTSR